MQLRHRLFGSRASSCATNSQPIYNDASAEAKLELRLALRLNMQQGMTEQLTAIRKSIEAVGEDRSREIAAAVDVENVRIRNRGAMDP